MNALKSIFATLLILTIFVSGAYAINDKKNDKKEEKPSTTTEASKLKGVKLFDKVPIMDKDICALDLQFDIVVEGKKIALINKSTGEFSDIEVIFGDGKISNDLEAKHTYDTPGVYYLAVSIYNEDTACMDFVGGNVYIGADEETKQVLNFDDFKRGTVANLSK